MTTEELKDKFEYAILEYSYCLPVDRVEDIEKYVQFLEQQLTNVKHDLSHHKYPLALFTFKHEEKDVWVVGEIQEKYTDGYFRILVLGSTKGYDCGGYHHGSRYLDLKADEVTVKFLSDEDLRKIREDRQKGLL